MTLFNPTAAVAPPVLTTTQAQAFAVLRLQQGVQNTYNILLAQHIAGMKEVWENADKLTPQQVFDAVGVSGVTLLSRSEALIQVLLSTNPATPLYTVPNILTPNPDGTVTVGAPITPA